MAARAKQARRKNQAHGYWAESTRPLVSLAFVAPMLIMYEGGMLLLGPDAMRNMLPDQSQKRDR